MPLISAQAAAMLKTTIAFTMQEGSRGYNVLPQEASVCANLRFIPHQGTDESIALITDMAKQFGLETEVIYKGYPSKSLDLKGEVCDNCVRFSPVLYGPEQLAGMHGLNENIEVNCLPPAVDYYKAIVRAQEKR